MTDTKALTVPQVISTGEPEAGVPRSFYVGFGTYGVTRGSSGIKVTARQLYLLRKRHPFVAAVHNAIIKQVKKVELEVCPIDPKKDYDEQTKAKMEEFVKTGFGIFGEKEFRGRMVDTKKWYGDSFGEIVLDPQTKEPVLVNYIFAETMRILPDEHGQIIGYPQVVDGGLVQTFNPENIIHLKEHEDEYSFFGYSDLESLLVALLLDTLADEHSIEKLKNDAIPFGAFVFDDESIEDADISRLRAQFIVQLRQAPNKPVFLNRRCQWLPMAATGLKDMDFQELHRTVREKVMMVYGVLPMQIAVVETGKLANPDQQLEIGEEYIRQELESIENSYNLKFTPRFQNSQNLKYRFKELQPKLETKEKEAQILNTKATTARILAAIPGTFTRNEIRAIVDADPLEDTLGNELISAPAYSDPNQPNLNSAEMGSVKSIETKPFAGYTDFQDCVDQNSDKDNPNAYCASIMQVTEGKAIKSEKEFETKALVQFKVTRAQGQRKMMDDLELEYSRFLKKAITIARKEYNPKKSKKSISEFGLLILPLLNALKETMQGATKNNAKNIYQGAKTALGFSFNQKDEKTLNEILSLKKGAFDAITTFTEDQKKNLVETLRSSFDEGKSTQQMVKDMREYADLETYKLERIARTEAHRVAYKGRVSGYKDLEERRGEKYVYDWNGPDDEKTSDECKAILDNNPYPLDELENLTDGGIVHPNERHTITRRVE